MQNLYSPVRIRSSPPYPPSLPTPGRVGRKWRWVLCVLLGACSDPPDPTPTPGPAGLPRWSTAPHVLWAGPDDPVTRPSAIFVDVPGGPLDQIAADPDVTTFLNDRFHPWFILPSRVDHLRAGHSIIFDVHGCVLKGPTTPSTTAEWIEGANSALLALKALEPGRTMKVPPEWDFSLPEKHPLHGICKR